jgi:hypothetical protein
MFRSNRTTAILGVLAALAGGLACSSAIPTETPGVSEVGENTRLYEGPDLLAAIGTRFAEQNLGKEYLILEVAFSGPGAGRVAEVDRDRISVRTPDGRRLPLMSQREFGEAYGELYAVANQLERLSSPTTETGGFGRPCGDWFFRKPGDGLARDVLFISALQSCRGPLFFRVPGGVQPGRWEIEIGLEESTAEIPFFLERY